MFGIEIIAIEMPASIKENQQFEWKTLQFSLSFNSHSLQNTIIQKETSQPLSLMLICIFSYIPWCSVYNLLQFSILITKIVRVNLVQKFLSHSGNVTKTATNRMTL